MLYYEEPAFVCPAEFWPALGYTGKAGYVALWWSSTTGEACCRDGRATTIGAEPVAYRLLLQRNFAPGHPAHWLLGAEGTPATMWLLVERATGRAWLVAADDGPGLLAVLNAGPDDVQDAAADGLGVFSGDAPTPREWEWRGAWLEPPLSPAERAEATAAATARHDALVAALARTA